MLLRMLVSELMVVLIALGNGACDKSQRAARSAQPAVQKTTHKVEKGAKSTGEALKPAANKVARGINRGVSGIKKGGDAVGKALGAK